ncbi:MAG: hypothetical protein CME71_02545 [Halobacteriovorax sp.]|nr:hypothetical protein [Halobacteriovorax sp.]
MLKAKQLSYAYSELAPALENISFTIDKSQMLGIIGPNGGGKSTLLKLIVGLLPMQTGTLEFNEKPLSQTALAYIPQSQELNDSLPMRVSDFLELIPKKASRSLDECLDRVGILDKKNDLMRELSGGQRQRALLARALRCSPEILILDEPTTGLDGQGQDQLMQLLKSLQHEEKTTIVVVDHNLGQVLKHADKVLCLNKSHHWHESKELLTKNIIEDIYHCEFEHIRLHEAGATFDDHHHECQHDHSHEHDGEGKKDA